MSKYTTQVRYIVEGGVDLFDFDYPIFDEAYRGVLEQKIIDYYYFREIGLETVGQFKHFLKSKLNVIMPYYNQLYGTEHLITKDDYYINLDSTETHTRTVTQDKLGTSEATSTGSSDSTANRTGTVTNKDVFSDTPQAKLQNLDYATNMNESDGTNTDDSTESVDSTGTISSTDTDKITTIEDYTVKMLGGGGVRYNSDILMEWRKTFLNIDQQIIDELKDLFMNIY